MDVKPRRLCLLWFHTETDKESDLWWRDNEHVVVGGTTELRERDAGRTWSSEGREMGAGLTLCHTLCLASYMHLVTCGRKDIR